MYGFGIVGTGVIAGFHARALRHVTGARLAGACGRSPEKTAAFAAAHGCPAYENLDALLAAPDVDILLVATPSGAHLEPALAAARARKHALCEKPLEITAQRIDAMIHAHRAAGTRLGCIFQFRYMRAVAILRNALAQGCFGTLTYAGAYVPWWREPAYYEKGSWHGTRALDGGGALMNQAIHMIDLLCDLMPPVREVAGVTSNAGHPWIEAEDAAVAALRFEGGAVGVIHGTTSAWPGARKRLEISGTRGSAVLEDDRLTRFEFAEPHPDDAAATAAAEHAAIGAADPAAMTERLHTACFQDFVDALTDGRPFATDGLSARRPVALVQAVYAAAATGQTVKIDT